jgi:iron-sulfur cluster assembly protein
MTVEQYQPKTQANIQLSESASRRLIKVIQMTEGAQAMRLSVKKSGCSGYAYDLKCVSEIYSQDLIIDLGDGYKLTIDAQSYPFLEGLKLDYVKEGLQHKFTYHNPKQTGQCGCGESFSVKSIS